MDDKDQAAMKILENFSRQYWKDIKAAYECGALSENESPYVVARCVLQLSAEKFYIPSLGDSEAVLNNLKHFI